MEKLSGELSTVKKLDGSLSPLGSLSGELTVPKTMSRYQYKGDYEVEPRFEEQKLHTKDMYMTDDVTVKKIPVYKTKNASGGYTLYVAERVDE